MSGNYNGIRKIMTFSHLKSLICLAVTPWLFAGCMVGPTYHRPHTEVPGAYKELTPDDFKSTEGWKKAQPGDDALRGKWWEIFNDPLLNALEEKVNVSNQNIAAAAASFLAARALVKEARSQLFPTVTTSPAITRQRPSSTLSGGAGGAPLPRRLHLPTIPSPSMRPGSRTCSAVSGIPSDRPPTGRRPARRTSKTPASSSRPMWLRITFNFADRMH